MQATPLEVSDFNPRPRKEGDPDYLIKRLDSIISIHALVKRATGNTGEV